MTSSAGLLSAKALQNDSADLRRSPRVGQVIVEVVGINRSR
jgi:hypothetical protein